MLRAVWAAVPALGAALEAIAERCNLPRSQARCALDVLANEYGHVVFSNGLWFARVPLGQQKD